MKNQQLIFLLFVLVVLLNFSGINTPFFTADPSVYAMLSKTMVEKCNFNELFLFDYDWLDKPHFPFWVTAFSFKLFGFTTFAYKFPAILFCLLSVCYTYLLAKDLYSKEVGLFACLVLLTAQHTVLFNNDVRAEPFLMPLIIGSIYHFRKLQLSQKINYHLFIGSMLAAFSVMTKGIFALIPIVAAIGAELLFTKNIKEILKIKWLLAILMTAVFTLPEVYALYVQFDSQPDKDYLGIKGVSGINWFLWGSQFGRFFGSGRISKESGSLTYYMVSMLMTFSPWGILYFTAVVKSGLNILRKKKLKEYYTLFGGIVLLAIFSVSSFQLPHYVLILFPLFAISIICIEEDTISNGLKNWIVITQYITIVSFYLFVIAVIIVTGIINYFVIALIVLITSVLYYFIYKQKELTLFKKLILYSCTASFFLNAYLNILYIPNYASRLGENHAARYVNETLPNSEIVLLDKDKFSRRFDFYTPQTGKYIELSSIENKTIDVKDKISLVNLKSYQNIKNRNIKTELIKKFGTITSDVLIEYKYWNKETRKERTKGIYLIRFLE